MTLVAACLVGCGAAAPRVTRIEPLPALPFALDEGPRELRTAWTRAEALLGEPPPEAPGALATLDEAGAWADQTLLPWAQAYLDRMSDITDPLAGAVALDRTLRVFAASIAALLYERLLGVLLHVPVPTEIEGEPDTVAAYRQAFLTAVGSAPEDTRSLLAECVESAALRSDAQSWAENCAERRDALDR